MGRGRQVRHGRIHRRGGATHQRAAGRQASVHVSGARGRAHGQPREVAGSAAVRYREVQSHFGPEPEDLRR